MKRLNMVFKFPHSVALLAMLCTLLWQGCPPPPPNGCTTPIDPNQAFPVHNLGYGAGARLDVTQYDAITLRRGDQVTLLFPCPPVLAAAAPTGLTVAINGDSALVTVSTTGVATGASLTLFFSTPSYEFTVNVVGDVWPGDANADGRRNMHDLMPIALGIRLHISGPGATALNYPPDPGQMLAFHDISDWTGKTFVFGGDPINFKHADCNLDGKITREDVEYLRAVLGPVAPPNLLADAVHGMRLRAVYDTQNPIEITIAEDGQMGVRIGFDIEVEDPNGYADTIFGVLFTRPVTETADYQVDTTTFRFLGPNLFGVQGADVMLWGQRFWHTLNIVNHSKSCIDVSDKPLDVGVFKVEGPLPDLGSANSARCGNCQVTLIDILRSGQPMPSSIDFQHHLINGVAYTLSGSGLGIQSLDCENTSTQIDLSPLCDRQREKPLIRDAVQDNGSGSVAHVAAWDSPDIWVRLLNDNGMDHQAAVPGQIVYVQVRVHNPNCEPINNATVTIYASEYNSSLTGGGLVQVGTALITNLPAWGSGIVSIPWKPSNSLSHGDPAAATYALLATVGTSGTPVPALPVGPLTSTVLDHPTVAMRCTKVLRAADGTETAAEFPVGWSGAWSNVTLNLQLVQGSSSHPASEYGKLRINVANVQSNICSGGTLVGADDYEILPTTTYAAMTLTGPSNVRASFKKHPNGGPSSTLSYTYLMWLTVNGTQYPGVTFKITLP